MQNTNSKKLSKKAIKSTLATVMIVDIVNYSNTTSKVSREEFATLHDAFDTITSTMVEKHDGEIIKKSGDAYFVTFSSGSDAIVCAVEMQYTFKQYSLGKMQKIYTKIALNTGDVLKRKKDIYGDVVNATSRMEKIAKPSDIIVSESTFRANNANTIPFKFIGTKKFKGIKYPIKLFLVKKPYETILDIEDPNSTKVKLKKIIKNVIVDGAIILLIIACLAALGGLVWYLL